jgi:hypothetical protein
MRNPNFHDWNPTPVSGSADERAAPYVEQSHRPAAAELDSCRWRYPDGGVCGQPKGSDDHVRSIIPDPEEEHSWPETERSEASVTDQ